MCPCGAEVEITAHFFLRCYCFCQWKWNYSSFSSVSLRCVYCAFITLSFYYFILSLNIIIYIWLLVSIKSTQINFTYLGFTLKSTLTFQTKNSVYVSEGSLKMMKNAFYFILKALFVCKIFKFLSWLFGHIKKRLDEKDKVNFKSHDVATWSKTITILILPNITQSVNEIWSVNRI